MNQIFLELETYEVKIYQDTEAGSWEFFKSQTNNIFPKGRKELDFRSKFSQRGEKSSIPFPKKKKVIHQFWSFPKMQKQLDFF